MTLLCILLRPIVPCVPWEHYRFRHKHSHHTTTGTAGREPLNQQALKAAERKREAEHKRVAMLTKNMLDFDKSATGGKPESGAAPKPVGARTMPHLTGAGTPLARATQTSHLHLATRKTCSCTGTVHCPFTAAGSRRLSSATSSGALPPAAEARSLSNPASQPSGAHVSMPLLPDPTPSSGPPHAGTLA
jgi:hypothetical protein